MRVESLYESSFSVSNSAIASSKACKSMQIGGKGRKKKNRLEWVDLWEKYIYIDDHNWSHYKIHRAHSIVCCFHMICYLQQAYEHAKNQQKNTQQPHISNWFYLKKCMRLFLYLFSRNFSMNFGVELFVSLSTEQRLCYYYYFHYYWYQYHISVSKMSRSKYVNFWIFPELPITVGARSTGGQQS